MSRGFTFHAPLGLSVARVRFQTPDQKAIDWITTPSDRTYHFEDMAPGAYTALIEPLGQPPIPFVFEAGDDQPDELQAPPLAALMDQANSAVEIHPEALSSMSGGKDYQAFEEVKFDPAIAATAEESKAISVGLSQDTAPGRIGGWRPFEATGLEPQVAYVAGGLDIVIPRGAEPLPAPGAGARLRLSVAIEGTRVERVMVPLFQGGVRVSLRASPLTTADLAIVVSPVDPERRALAQALRSGLQDEAVAVAKDLMNGGGVERYLDAALGDDPFTVLLVALLAVRFPSAFGQVQDLSAALVERYPWVIDAHILRARNALTEAGRNPSPDARRRGAAQALASLAEGRRMGAPYFAYANQLNGEMLGALAAAGLDDDLKQAAERELNAWRRDITLQRSAGVAFSWMMRARRKAGHDEREPDEDVSQAYATTRGALDERFAKILFLGHVDLMQIQPRGPTPPQKAAFASKSAPISAAPTSDDPPALHRPVTVPNDLNKGRFGGQAEKDGYRLSVAFTGTDGKNVKMTLSVTADPGQHEPNYSDTVEFFLHDSFQPSRVHAAFRGHEASLPVVSWGGFTVGVWIPSAAVELELDLAQVEGAPEAIRLY